MSAEGTQRTEHERLAELDRGVEKMRAHERRQLTINVDRAWQEHQRDAAPIEIVFEGTTYTVPPNMPADFGMFYTRHCLQPIEVDGRRVLLFQIDDERLEEFLRLLVGQAFVDAIATSRIEFQFIRDQVIRPVMAHWGAIFDSGEAKSAAVGEKKSDATPES